jgi:ketosteroid isomerase-like protein
MSLEQTEQTMRGYLDALMGGEDFASWFADDVVWTTMESGEEVRGRDNVREEIASKHHRQFEATPELRSFVCGDGIAQLEAVFVARHVDTFAGIPATGAQVRVPYMMAYDVDGDRITALRAYLSDLAIVAQLQAARPATAAR